MAVLLRSLPCGAPGDPAQAEPHPVVQHIIVADIVSHRCRKQRDADEYGDARNLVYMNCCIVQQADGLCLKITHLVARLKNLHLVIQRSIRGWMVAHFRPTTLVLTARTRPRRSHPTHLTREVQLMHAFLHSCRAGLDVMPVTWASQWIFSISQVCVKPKGHVRGVHASARRAFRASRGHDREQLSVVYMCFCALLSPNNASMF